MNNPILTRDELVHNLEHKRAHSEQELLSLFHRALLQIVPHLNSFDTSISVPFPQAFDGEKPAILQKREVLEHYLKKAGYTSIDYNSSNSTVILGI